MRRILVTILMLATFWQGTAVAQEPTEAETAEARRAFEQGIAFAEEESWAEAIREFERAYRLVESGAIQINLATAFAQVNRLTEAADSYRRFLRTSDDAGAEVRARVQAELDALDARIPVLAVSIEGLLPSDEITVDGRVVEGAALSAGIQLDPGQHRVHVHRDDSVVGSVRLGLGEGEREQRNIVVLDSSPPGNAGDSGISAAWWIAGGVVIAAVIGVGLYFLLGSSDQLMGNFGDGRVVIGE